MYFEDYVLRQVAFAAAVASKVLGLSEKGQFKEAYELIDRAIEEMLGLNAGVVKQMNDEGLVNLLRSSQFVDSERFIALANLFIVEGDVLASQKRGTECRQSYQRALNLFNIFSSHYPDSLDTDIQTWINDLQQKLKSAAE